MKDSKIEWCDHTFNPWEGCTKVSPGCAHCYAEARNARFGGGSAPNWGPGAPRRRTSASNWKLPVRWNNAVRDARELCKFNHAFQREAGGENPWPNSPRVFCASLADWLDDEVPIEWLADLLVLIHDTPHLDWLLLTKRPEHWRARIEHAIPSMETHTTWAAAWLRGDEPSNVWIGTTVEDQVHADERIPALLGIPAKVRFLSCEPLLGPVEFSDVTHRSDFRSQVGKKSLAGIHWVICGGESGRHARPMHPDWARSLRDQCVAAELPFFFKQWGEWSPYEPDDDDSAADICRWVTPNREVSEHGNPSQDEPMFRTGKKAAGRLLDGRAHGEFPQIGGAA